MQMKEMNLFMYIAARVIRNGERGGRDARRSPDAGLIYQGRKVMSR